MMHSTNQGNGNQQGQVHPALSPTLEAFKTVKSSGHYYLFVGGGRSGVDSEINLQGSLSDCYSLLKDAAWGLSNELQEPGTMVIGEIYKKMEGRTHEFVVVGVRAFSPDHGESRMVFLGAYFRQYGVSEAADYLCRHPDQLVHVLGTFDPQFASGELFVESVSKIARKRQELDA